MSYYSQTQSNPINVSSGTNDNPIVKPNVSFNFHVVHHDYYIVKNSNTDAKVSNTELDAEVELDESVDRHLMSSNYRSLRSN